jgi:putative membrane protein
VKDLVDALAALHPELAADGTLVKLQSAAAQTAAGSQALAGALSQAAAGAEQLAAGAQQLQMGAGALGDGVASYVAGVGSGAAGASRLYAGLSTLAAGGQTLASGLAQAQSGAQSLSAGGASLADGAGSLAEGIASAGEGAADLSSGLEKLREGSASLAGGLAEGASGSQELATGLKSSADRVPNYTEVQRDAAVAVMSDPIALEENELHDIPNYGTGFAPYFIPLALWVGALMTYFLIRALSARALASTASDLTVALSGFWPAAAVTAVQAVILMLVLQFALGIRPANVAAFYLFVVLLALVSTAIMQFLSGAFGTAGKFAAVVLLMLQLTSSAGTFPVETIPRFFRAINPFLPMTYGVLGLRQAITSGDLGSLAWDVGALVAFGVIAMAATVFTVHRRRTWTMEQLKPLAAI